MEAAGHGPTRLEEGEGGAYGEKEEKEVERRKTRPGEKKSERKRKEDGFLNSIGFYFFLNFFRFSE